MSDVSELITQWRDKKLSGLGLMRGLVSHEKWALLITEAAAADMVAHNATPRIRIIGQPNGEKWLQLFSSGATYSVFAKANSITEEQHTLDTRGTWVFNAVFDQVDRIWIDPFNAHDIFYEKPQLGALRDMANAVLVEEALARLRSGQSTEDDLKAAREYKNYYVAATTNSEGRMVLLMAPDTKGRRLGAAFTSDDTFDAFLPEARQMANGAEVKQIQTDGAGLFDTFQRMPMDGFVFNCSGPITAVAFAQAAAGIVMQG